MGTLLDPKRSQKNFGYSDIIGCAIFLHVCYYCMFDLDNWLVSGPSTNRWTGVDMESEDFEW